jgi:hypothetical protein
MKTARAAFFGASILFTVTGAAIGFTQAGIDWKFYGGASLDGASLCFYDAIGVVREPGNQVRVWTKCLPQETLDQDNPAKMTEDAAQKIRDG